MSSAADTSSIQEDSIFDSAYMEAISIAGIVMASLVALIVLRIFVNSLIDICILGDLSSLRRLGNFVRRLFPWFHPRTQPEEQPTANEITQRTVVELIPGVDRMMLKDNIEHLLPHKILSNSDIQKMQSGEERCDGVCSICLVDFAIGDKTVVEEKCSNIFHKSCLMDWILQGPDVNAKCPHCRSQLISTEALGSIAV